jgi:hypothetical protein
LQGSCSHEYKRSGGHSKTSDIYCSPIPWNVPVNFFIKEFIVDGGKKDGIAPSPACKDADKTQMLDGVCIHLLQWMENLINEKEELFSFFLICFFFFF